jgi:hypothetical protein
MELITIKTVDASHHLFLLKNIFDAAGIEYYVFDENIVTAYPWYSNSVGGIKLKIRKRDFNQVCELLKGTEHELLIPEQTFVGDDNFLKHMLTTIFTKEAILVIIGCIMFIGFMFYSFYKE